MALWDRTSMTPNDSSDNVWRSTWRTDTDVKLSRRQEHHHTLETCHGTAPTLLPSMAHLAALVFCLWRSPWVWKDSCGIVGLLGTVNPTRLQSCEITFKAAAWGNLILQDSSCRCEGSRVSPQTLFTLKNLVRWEEQDKVRKKGRSAKEEWEIEENEEWGDKGGYFFRAMGMR